MCVVQESVYGDGSMNKPVRFASAFNRRKGHDQLVASALDMIRAKCGPCVFAWVNKTQAGRTAEGRWIGNRTHKGAADIVVCANGVYLELEAKTGKGRLSKEQQEQMDKVRSANGIYSVFRDPEEAAELATRAAEAFIR